jgi:undecaprenyl-diphosphatase
MLHIGTLVALLLYFRADWLRLIPAGFAAIRHRSLGGDPDRRLAWLIAVATIPALVLGYFLNDLAETRFREIGLVALMLIVGGAILWLAERRGSRRKVALDLTFANALAIGGAQALALVPGISRSGISIAAGLFAGLERESAARFSFLMATPITAAAAAYETVKVVSGDAGLVVDPGALGAGLVASFGAGLLAIAVLLRFLRTRSTDVFIAYRVILAAVVLVTWLG